MDYAGGVSVIMLIVGICSLVLSISLMIAPLIIWRNTNRTNRLLASLLIRMNVSKREILDIWTAEAESEKNFRALFGQDGPNVKSEK